MTPQTLPPRLQRGGAILALVVAAPLCAEFLVAYLEITGDFFASAFAVIFFIPIYGGAALLIREIGLRTGRGWPGRLLLAAAFGVAMTTIIDLSLWTPERPEIEFWDELQAAAWMPALGISGYAALTWVLGHVLMSVSAPLVIVETIAPGLRERRWLGPIGLALWPIGFVAIGTSIHISEKDLFNIEVSPLQYAAATGVVLLLVGLAFSPLGRPRRRHRSPGLPSPVALGVIGGVGMACLDFTPFSWAGVLGLACIVVVYAVLVHHWSLSPAWSQNRIAAFTWGALLAHTVIGMASPLPEGVSMTAKVLHTVVLTAIVLAVGYLMLRQRPANSH